MDVLSLSEHTDWLHTGSSFIGHTTIPSCVVAAVCHEFSEADDIYIGFKLAEL